MISMFDELNRTAEGEKEGGQSMMRVNFVILKSFRQGPRCLFVAVAIVSGKLN